MPHGKRDCANVIGVRDLQIECCALCWWAPANHTPEQQGTFSRDRGRGSKREVEETGEVLAEGPRGKHKGKVGNLWEQRPGHTLHQCKEPSPGRGDEAGRRSSSAFAKGLRAQTPKLRVQLGHVTMELHQKPWHNRVSSYEGADLVRFSKRKSVTSPMKRQLMPCLKRPSGTAGSSSLNTSQDLISLLP